MVETVTQQALQEPQQQSATIAPAVAPPTRHVPLTGMAKWVHENRDATKQPVGHVVYQVIRNLFAAVPYGIATIAVWSGFERATEAANKRIFEKTGMEMAKFRYETAKVSEMTNKLPVTSALQKFMRSPIRDIAMIAAGFTLYRGTLKLVKFTKERLFNPNNTEEDTKREVDNFGSNLVKDFKEIAPAEMSSTPIGAIALGLGRRYVNGSDDYTSRNPMFNIGSQTRLESIDPASTKGHRGLLTKAGDFAERAAVNASSGEKSSWKEFCNKVFHPKSRPLTEAAILIGSFITFFELSDRTYKDVQIRRGIHKENHNSITRVAPEKADIKEQQEKALGLDKDAKYQIEKRGEGKDDTLFGAEPNLGRFLMTRVLSTALGIGAYTLTKRASYAVMGHYTSSPTFMGKALVEGLATSTFFTMCMSNDIIEGLFNKHVVKPKADNTPLQQQNHDALLAKLNEKYKANGVAA